MLELRHYLPVQRLILRTCHVSEENCAKLVRGEVPENLCETCVGASKNVQRLFKICTAQFLHITWGGELPRMRLRKFCAFFQQDLNFLIDQAVQANQLSTLADRALAKERQIDPILPKLSGNVSCDAAAIRIRIRIVRCQRPAKRQKHKPCETQTRFSSPTSPCW